MEIPNGFISVLYDKSFKRNKYNKYEADTIYTLDEIVDLIKVDHAKYLKLNFSDRLGSIHGSQELDDSIKLYTQQTDLIKYYTLICPEGISHTFENNICKKCGFQNDFNNLNDSNNSNNSNNLNVSKYYNKYNKKYLHEISLRESAAFKNFMKDFNVKGIEYLSKYSISIKSKSNIKNTKKISINTSIVSTISKKFNIPINLIINIGSYQGNYMTDISSNIVKPDFTNNRILVLSNYMVSLAKFYIILYEKINIDLIPKKFTSKMKSVSIPMVKSIYENCLSALSKINKIKRSIFLSYTENLEEQSDLTYNLFIEMISYFMNDLKLEPFIKAFILYVIENETQTSKYRKELLNIYSKKEESDDTLQGLEGDLDLDETYETDETNGHIEQEEDPFANNDLTDEKGEQNMEDDFNELDVDLDLLENNMEGQD
jgi:hypothetical protein